MKVKRGQNRERNGLGGMVASAALIAAALAAFALFSVQFGNRTGARDQETLKKAIARASVQCYAIEGRYPPSVEYLEENYGVMINRKKYHVFYDGFASNVMPDITVVPVTAAE